MFGGKKQYGIKVLEPSQTLADNSKAKFITIVNLNKLQFVLSEINKIGICSIDTETDSLDIQKANLVGISLCYDENLAYYIPIKHKELISPWTKNFKGKKGDKKYRGALHVRVG